LRAQLALEEANKIAGTITENMLDFGPEWGRMESESEEDEKMEIDLKADLDRAEQVRMHAEAKEQFAATR
jgi:hypothetical protein